MSDVEETALTDDGSSGGEGSFSVSDPSSGEENDVLNLSQYMDEQENSSVSLQEVQEHGTNSDAPLDDGGGNDQLHVDVSLGNESLLDYGEHQHRIRGHSRLGSLMAPETPFYKPRGTNTRKRAEGHKIDCMCSSCSSTKWSEPTPTAPKVVEVPTYPMGFGPGQANAGELVQRFVSSHLKTLEAQRDIMERQLSSKGQVFLEMARMCSLADVHQHIYRLKEDLLQELTRFPSYEEVRACLQQCASSEQVDALKEETQVMRDSIGDIERDYKLKSKALNKLLGKFERQKALLQWYEENYEDLKTKYNELAAKAPKLSIGGGEIKRPPFSSESVGNAVEERDFDDLFVMPRGILDLTVQQVVSTYRHSSEQFKRWLKTDRRALKAFFKLGAPVAVNLGKSDRNCVKGFLALQEVCSGMSWESEDSKEDEDSEAKLPSSSAASKVFRNTGDNSLSSPAFKSLVRNLVTLTPSQLEKLIKLPVEALSGLMNLSSECLEALASAPVSTVEDLAVAFCTDQVVSEDQETKNKAKPEPTVATTASAGLIIDVDTDQAPGSPLSALKSPSGIVATSYNVSPTSPKSSAPLIAGQMLSPKAKNSFGPTQASYLPYCMFQSKSYEELTFDVPYIFGFLHKKFAPIALREDEDGQETIAINDPSYEGGRLDFLYHKIRKRHATSPSGIAGTTLDVSRNEEAQVTIKDLGDLSSDSDVADPRSSVTSENDEGLDPKTGDMKSINRRLFPKLPRRAIRTPRGEDHMRSTSWKWDALSQTGSYAEEDIQDAMAHRSFGSTSGHLASLGKTSKLMSTGVLMERHIAQNLKLRSYQVDALIQAMRVVLRCSQMRNMIKFGNYQLVKSPYETSKNAPDVIPTKKLIVSVFRRLFTQWYDETFSPIGERLLVLNNTYVNILKELEALNELAVEVKKQSDTHGFMLDERINQCEKRFDTLTKLAKDQAKKYKSINDTCKKWRTDVESAKADLRTAADTIQGQINEKEQWLNRMRENTERVLGSVADMDKKMVDIRQKLEADRNRFRHTVVRSTARTNQLVRLCHEWHSHTVSQMKALKGLPVLLSRLITDLTNPGKRSQDGLLEDEGEIIKGASDSQLLQRELRRYKREYKNLVEGYNKVCAEVAESSVELNRYGGAEIDKYGQLAMQEPASQLVSSLGTRIMVSPPSKSGPPPTHLVSHTRSDIAVDIQKRERSNCDEVKRLVSNPPGIAVGVVVERSDSTDTLKELLNEKKNLSANLLDDVPSVNGAMLAGMHEEKELPEKKDSKMTVLREEKEGSAAEMEFKRDMAETKEVCPVPSAIERQLGLQSPSTDPMVWNQGFKSPQRTDAVTDASAAELASEAVSGTADGAVSGVTVSVRKATGQSAFDTQGPVKEVSTTKPRSPTSEPAEQDPNRSPETASASLKADPSSEFYDFVQARYFQHGPSLQQAVGSYQASRLLEGQDRSAGKQSLSSQMALRLLQESGLMLPGRAQSHDEPVANPPAHTTRDSSLELTSLQQLLALSSGSSRPDLELARQLADPVTESDISNVDDAARDAAEPSKRITKRLGTAKIASDVAVQREIYENRKEKRPSTARNHRHSGLKRSNKRATNFNESRYSHTHFHMPSSYSKNYREMRSTGSVEQSAPLSLRDVSLPRVNLMPTPAVPPPRFALSTERKPQEHVPAHRRAVSDPNSLVEERKRRLGVLLHGISGGENIARHYNAGEGGGGYLLPVPNTSDRRRYSQYAHSQHILNRMNMQRKEKLGDNEEQRVEKERRSQTLKRRRQRVSSARAARRSTPRRRTGANTSGDYNSNIPEYVQSRMRFIHAHLKEGQ